MQGVLKMTKKKCLCKNEVKLDVEWSIKTRNMKYKGEVDHKLELNQAVINRVRRTKVKVPLVEMKQNRAL